MSIFDKPYVRVVLHGGPLDGEKRIFLTKWIINGRPVCVMYPPHIPVIPSFEQEPSYPNHVEYRAKLIRGKFKLDRNLNVIMGCS